MFLFLELKCFDIYMFLSIVTDMVSGLNSVIRFDMFLVNIFCFVFGLIRLFLNLFFFRKYLNGMLEYFRF